MKRSAACLTAACITLFGCAPTLPQPYRVERAAAERSYASGRYDEAAAHWLKASRLADRKRDRLEARYRSAASLRRAGRDAEAAELLRGIERDAPKSARAERAAFDLANLEIERGNRARGYAALANAIFAHPSSGLAPGALRRYLAFVEDEHGLQAALAWLERARPKLRASELDELVQYERARLLEKSGDVRQALSGYLESAQSHPYPEGALWDDALYAASLLEEKLGNNRRAILHLERMLAEREQAELQGSYERPRFAQARFRIAVLMRDRLGDARGARREFRRVFVEHPTSLLRDDALWNEALLARESGARDADCDPLGLLLRTLPDSRYAACAHTLCAKLPKLPARECRPYVLHELAAKSSSANQHAVEEGSSSPPEAGRP